MHRRVLIIDDEPDITDLTSTFLSFHNLYVDTVNDPEKVKPTIQKTKYDLVLIDLMMPKINGFDIISLIKKDNENQRIPIIVMSAKVLTDKERKFLVQHKVEFVMKPFEPKQLMEQIQNTINRAQL